MRKRPIVCTFCNKPAVREVADDVEFFAPKSQNIFLCDNCFHSFNAGSVLGQVQFNNRMIGLILSMDDDSLISEMKEKLLDYSPSSKNKMIPKKPAEVMSPIDFFEFLSVNVIGQDNAKRRIALAAFEHLKNIRSKNNDKQNILLLGPSGSGKTLIVNTLSHAMNLPFVLSDSTSLSPTGFQGADSDSVIFDLLSKSEGEISLAEKGIVFLDEIDKLATQSSPGTRLESFNYATQSTLLKLIEGKRIKVPMSMTPEGSSVRYIDTSKIMFCLGGAFNGLEKIVGKKIGHKEQLIGFRNDTSEDYSEMIKTYEIYSKASHDVMVDSLIEYGMATELVGRIQTIAPLAPLSKDQLLSCLYDLENSPLKRNKVLFAESNIELDFDESFLEAVCEKAMKTGTGTRALSSIIKTSVSIAAFNYLGIDNDLKRIIITKECLDNPSDFVTV
jgi:ATP-dependent Clp protease ATP-binding subunit ClpX